jgi:thiamine pyrophosphate-dependent acetolactate synthase large subunit-like protein
MPICLSQPQRERRNTEAFSDSEGAFCFLFNVEDIPYVIKEAFYPARSGRPGPVLIDVT